MSEPFISRFIAGELCYCGARAEFKVEEVMMPDHPLQTPSISYKLDLEHLGPRHPLTAFVCRPHFFELMGPMAARIFGEIS